MQKSPGTMRNVPGAAYRRAELCGKLRLRGEAKVVL